MFSCKEAKSLFMDANHGKLQDSPDAVVSVGWRLLFRLKKAIIMDYGFFDAFNFDLYEAVFLL